MSSEDEEKAKKLRHLDNLINELVSTEAEYIKNMSYIVNGYLTEFRKKEDALVPVPDDLRDNKGIFVFANIEKIYFWHKEYFQQSLERNRHSPGALGKAFVESEAQFNMYAKYCNNKALSHLVVTEYSKYFDAVRKRLGHKLGINDFLIVPVQRLGKYELLLAQISKHLRELGGDWESMSAAYDMIKAVSKSVNDFTALQGIRDYDGDISDHGKLVFNGTLMCRYDKKNKRHHAFLFKRLLIFTNKHKSYGKHDAPTYKYKFKIPMNKLKLRELPNKSFMLETTDPNTQSLSIICHGEDDFMLDQWLEEIKRQLKIQAEFITDLVNPSCEKDAP